MKAHRSFAVLAAPDHLRFHALCEQQSVRRVRILRPGCTSAVQVFASSLTGCTSNTSTSPEKPTRAARTIAMEKLSNRSAPGNRPRAGIAGKSRNARSSQRSLRAIQHQHPRRRAIGERLLRDRRLGQVIIEIAKGPNLHHTKCSILGIETSCDETAAAVVEDGVTHSVFRGRLPTCTHGKYGGVVPELASREHLRAIVPVVRLALEQAGTSFDDLAAIAVTEGPGLVGSLLVGITYAKALCFARDLPLIAVNHIEGHIHAVILEAGPDIEYPALALVVSGGHTHLFEVREGFDVYRLLGKTRDDAAGEAYDKVAKLLGFGYPGGPVDRSARAPRQSARRQIHARPHERQHARLQLQRTEDRRAALGGSPRSCRRDRSAAPIRRAASARRLAARSRRNPRSICWPPFSTP